MNLYIMTRGRVGKQSTLDFIPSDWLDRTYLVVPKEEEHEHGHQALVVPPYVTNYSEKFQWLLNGPPFKNQEKAVILDDDLRFSRPQLTFNNKKSLLSIKPWEVDDHMSRLWEYMEKLLDDTALVSVHPRQMGNYTADPNYVENGKIICVQGINRRLIGDIKVDHYPILADVMLNCTLLSRGQGNKLITRYFQDHGSCQAPGGCSLYRTPEMQKEAVEFIANKFHPYAKAVIKRPKASKWMGDERTDLRVQWKKMYEDSTREP